MTKIFRLHKSYSASFHFIIIWSRWRHHHVHLCYLKMKLNMRNLIKVHDTWHHTWKKPHMKIEIHWKYWALSYISHEVRHHEYNTNLYLCILSGSSSPQQSHVALFSVLSSPPRVDVVSAHVAEQAIRASHGHGDGTSQPGRGLLRAHRGRACHGN